MAGIRTQLADIERDLLLVGISASALTRIGELLGRLSPLKRRAWVAYNVRVLRQECLPTLYDLNFACEARAVFGGLPSGDSEVTDSYKQFLGTVPIVIMELVTLDGGGNTKRMSVELPEDTFEWVRRTVARAHEQFVVLKQRTAGLAVSEGDSQQ